MTFANAGLIAVVEYAVVPEYSAEACWWPFPGVSGGRLFYSGAWCELSS